MEPVLKGQAPAIDAFGAEREYLIAKLSDARRDSQWLLSLGAAGVLGVVIKDNFGSAVPVLRMLVMLVSIVQISVSMVGALTWQVGKVNKASVITLMSEQLARRNALRNVSVVLLAVTFVLTAYIGLRFPSCKK